MTEFEIKEKDAVIIYIKPGKPDPHDSTRRTSQKAQKGPTCFYYSLNWIRDRYGKNSLPDQKLQRLHEQLVSSNRKKLTALFQQQEWEKKLVAAITEVKKRYPLEFLRTLTDEVITLPIPKERETEEAVESIITHFIEAHRQHRYPHFSKDGTTSQPNKYMLLFEDEALEKFMTERHTQQMMSHFSNCLLSYGVDSRDLTHEYDIYVDTLTEEARRKILVGKNTGTAYFRKDNTNFFDYLNKEYQYFLVHHCANSIEAQRYGLQIAGLKMSGIDELMHYLQTQGPLVITGNLGKAFYPPNSEKLNKMGKKSVYAFPPNTYTKQYTIGEHVIVVIGASRKGYENTIQDLVYYLDPDDESSPDHPVKTYIISYKSFEARLRNQRTFYLEAEKIKGMLHAYFYNPSYLSLKEKKEQKTENENTAISLPASIANNQPNRDNVSQNRYALFNCRNAAIIGLNTAILTTAVLYGLTYRS